MNPETIKKIKDHPDFKQLQEWMQQNIFELRIASDELSGVSDEQAGEEIKTNLKAAKTLEKMLEPFLIYAEPREHTAEEIQRKKERYGI